jgi:hypothetical protein
MLPQPDPRWANIVGGVTDDGPFPMSFEILGELADEWADIVPPMFGPDHGPIALLRMSRSLFVHSWFDYEFMAVACLVAFQAMEAAFRVLYPDAEKVPFRKLVARARDAKILPANIADIAITGVELRNLFSHPLTQTALTVGMADSMLENTHRLVALVMGSATHS